MLGSSPARRRKLLTLTEGQRMLVGAARARLMSWTESERSRLWRSCGGREFCRG